MQPWRFQDAGPRYCVLSTVSAVVHCQMAVAPLPNDAPAMRDLDALREVRAGGELIGRHRRGRLLTGSFDSLGL